MACLRMHLSVDLKRLWGPARTSVEAEGAVKARLKPAVCFRTKAYAPREGHRVGEKYRAQVGIPIECLCNVEASGCCFGNELY